MPHVDKPCPSRRACRARLRALGLRVWGSGLRAGGSGLPGCASPPGVAPGWSWWPAGRLWPGLHARRSRSGEKLCSLLLTPSLCPASLQAEPKLAEEKQVAELHTGPAKWAGKGTLGTKRQQPHEQCPHSPGERPTPGSRGEPCTRPSGPILAAPGLQAVSG